MLSEALPVFQTLAALIEQIGDAGIIAFPGFIFVLVGALKKYRSQRAARIAWLAIRAPVLDISEAKAGDDCWIRGRIITNHPVLIPHFRHKAAIYWYLKEELVNPQDDGYRTVEKAFDFVPFALESDSQRFEIRSHEAEEIHASKLLETGPQYRYSASYIGVGDYVNALGVVSNDGQSFGAGGEVPLVLTSASPGRFGEWAQTRARYGRTTGFLLIWAGLACISPLIFSLVSPSKELSEGWIAASILIGFAVLAWPFSIYWSVLTYNTLVERRNQILNARHLISIDLLQRQEVIPKLEIIIKEFCRHEGNLLERLSLLRTRLQESYSAEIEKECEKVRAVLHALYEQYPELKSQQQFTSLIEELSLIEKKVAYDRHFYNENVKVYNSQIRTFPDVLVAKATGQQAFPFFKFR